MSDQQKSVWRFLRIVGPIFIFLIVIYALTFMMSVPLVLAVVIACLLAIMDFVVLTWLMNRQVP